jgi:regulatory protein
MEIKSFKKEKGNKYKIIFKDNTDIILYDDVIVKYNLLINKIIDNKKIEEIVSYNNNLDAYYIALKYINKKMCTKLEIEKYLAKKDFNQEIIKETINKLENNKAIDEKLYVKSYCNDKINFSNIGPNKIATKLSLLGIKKEEIYDYLETIDKNIWLNKINKLIDKKIKSNKNYSVSLLKNKILNSLINDGYDKNMIIDVLNNKNIEVNTNIILKEYNKQKNKLVKKYDGEALEFQIKLKLKSKGFSNEEIDKIKKIDK